MGVWPSHQIIAKGCCQETEETPVSHPALIRDARFRIFGLLWAIPILTLLAILGVVVPAAAHSDLRSSTPASGASLDSPPQQVVLTFSEEVDPRYANVTLTAGGGRPHALSQEVAGNRVAAEVDEATAKTSGRWSVGYRVVSADGHPITGVLTFTVKLPAQPTPSPPSPISSSPGPSQSSTATQPTSLATAAVAPAEDSQTGTTGPAFSVILMILIGAAVAMMALGAAVWRARSKSPR